MLLVTTQTNERAHTSARMRTGTCCTSVVFFWRLDSIFAAIMLGLAAGVHILHHVHTSALCSLRIPAVKLHSYADVYLRGFAGHEGQGAGSRGSLSSPPALEPIPVSGPLTGSLTYKLWITQTTKYGLNKGSRVKLPSTNLKPDHHSHGNKCLLLLTPMMLKHINRKLQ